MRPRRILPHLAALCLLLLSFSCGYHNPNLLPAEELGPPFALHVPLWTGPSSEIRLAAEIHNALQDWLIQGKRITLVSEPGKADCVLNGRILSVHSPGRSYDARDSAQALKVILTVEYSLTDVRSGRKIWPERKQTLSKNYAVVASSTAQSERNRREALSILSNDLAEGIFLRLSRANVHQKEETPAAP
jgi:hypothetical protein